MRYWSRFFFMVLLLLLFCGQAGAYDAADAQQQLTGAVDAETRDLLDGVTLAADRSLLEQFSLIVENSLQKLYGSWTTGLRSLAAVAAIAILCGMVNGVRRVAGLGEELPIVSMVETLAIASTVLLDVGGLMSLCRQTLQTISVFSKTMLPVMATAVSLSGAPARAAAMQAATMLALDLMIRMVVQVLLPLLSVYLAIMTVNYAFGQQLLQKTGEFILWFIRTILKTALTLFVSYLTLSGVLGGSTDALAVKTAKAALSGAIPVVGGVISDATESLLAGAVMLRSFTGLFGILCIFCKLL